MFMRSLIFLLPLFLYGCTAAQPFTKAPAQELIRVALLKDAQSISVNMGGHFAVLDGRNGKTLFDGRQLRSIDVMPKKTGLLFGSIRFDTDYIRLISLKDITVKTGHKVRIYRGELDILRNQDDTILIINRIGLDDYIQGVLYHEISDRWPMEAIKAQAVAARSYALYRKSVNKDLPYDVTNDIYSQVYGGKTGERYRTNIAIERTRGEVVMFNGKILPAYFHANSGGLTEDAAELWNHDIQPLKGVKSDFSRNSPHFQWRKNFQSSKIQDKLNANGFELGLIKDIRVIERNRSGRIRNMVIETRDGKKTAISGKDFRRIIGPNVIRSNNFEVHMKGYYFDLVGYGWGHGVGMCQWGAREMSLQRYDYRQILQHYYPGSRIENYNQLRS